MNIMPSTPACAGLTAAAYPGAESAGLYPRVRGADAFVMFGGPVVAPLPPRARG